MEPLEVMAMGIRLSVLAARDTLMVTKDIRPKLLTLLEVRLPLLAAGVRIKVLGVVQRRAGELGTKAMEDLGSQEFQRSDLGTDTKGGEVVLEEALVEEEGMPVRWEEVEAGHRVDLARGGLEGVKVLVIMDMNLHQTGLIPEVAGEGDII